uniref:Uncharacterized protein n=1 Tax=Anguilla anguilla TaxID=7936 RepID=A0A0E9TNR5_ANGAN
MCIYIRYCFFLGCAYMVFKRLADESVSFSLSHTHRYI